MPKGQTAKSVLPEKLTFATVKGQEFAELEAAARLAGIHSDVLQMGRQLLRRPNEEAMTFRLATPELLKRKDELFQAIRGDLRRVLKALHPRKAAWASGRSLTRTSWSSGSGTLRDGSPRRRSDGRNP